MNDSFNIFEILSKDDKELSHSAFLKFLLAEDDGFFLEKLLNQNKEEKFNIELEVKLNKKLRLDLLLKSENKTIAIENKFKCLPIVAQLKSYSEELGEGTEKFLLYFADGKDFNLPDDWNTITYSKLSLLIDEYLEVLKAKKDNVKDQQLLNEKSIFIRHYNESLKRYITKYQKLKHPNSSVLREMFEQPNKADDSKNNKFWLHLMFHELAALFDAKGYYTWVGAGSSYKPLMNIHYEEWKHVIRGKAYEFVIQLNGRNLKYYAHLRGIENKQEIINNEINRLQENNFVTTSSGKFKGNISSKSNTCYIYQEDIISVLEENSKTITLTNLYEAIVDFRKRIGTEKHSLNNNSNLLSDS